VQERPSSPEEAVPREILPVRSARSLAVLATFLVLLLYVSVGAAVQQLNIAFGLWFTEIFVFLGVGWVMLRRNARPPLEYTRLARPRAGLLVFGFALGVANFFAFVVPIQFAMQAITPESWKFMDASQIFRGQTQLELALIVGAVGIAAPLCEEFFFRGVLQQGLMPPAFSRERAVVVTAVIFSAFHLDPVGFFARVQLGLLFGLLLLRTGSLWPGIAAHSANNLVSTVLYFAAGGLEPSAEAPAEAGLLGVAVISVGGLITFFGMMHAARRTPSLWRGARAERVAAQPVPAPSLLRLVLPWALAATAALGALVVGDARGLELQRVDQRLPLEPLRPGAPDAEQAERAALQELRARVRRGDAPLKAYAEERARLRERARQN
jgi:uncharacterized protein